MSVSFGGNVEGQVPEVLSSSYLSNASSGSGYYGFDHCDVSLQKGDALKSGS